MHRRAAGEVDRAQLVGDPAAEQAAVGRVEREHPVRDRQVDQRHPDRAEHQPRAEADPVHHGAADDRDRDRREQRLEDRDERGRQRRVRVLGDQVAQAEVRGDVTEQAGAAVGVPEDGGVAEQRPDERGHGDRAEGHHDDVEDAARPHHAAVEQGQPGDHEAHAHGGGQDPRRTCCVHRGSSRGGHETRSRVVNLSRIGGNSVVVTDSVSGCVGRVSSGGGGAPR